MRNLDIVIPEVDPADAEDFDTKVHEFEIFTQMSQ